MITLFTAIGRLQLRAPAISDNSHPVVIRNAQEYGLSIHEAVLWSCIAWNILTYEELRRQYYETLCDLHLTSELDFDHYLKRLTFRGLIASGTDYTGMDALYDLISRLIICPDLASVWAKATACIRLCAQNGHPLQVMKMIFSRADFSAQEKLILKMSRNNAQNAADLIRILEDAPSSPPGVQKRIRPTTAQLVQGRFASNRPATISAIANLYLKKQITFDSI